MIGLKILAGIGAVVLVCALIAVVAIAVQVFILDGPFGLAITMLRRGYASVSKDYRNYRKWSTKHEGRWMVVGTGGKMTWTHVCCPECCYYHDDD